MARFAAMALARKVERRPPTLLLLRWVQLLVLPLLLACSAALAAAAASSVAASRSSDVASSGVAAAAAAVGEADESIPAGWQQQREPTDESSASTSAAAGIAAGYRSSASADAAPAAKDVASPLDETAAAAAPVRMSPAAEEDGTRQEAEVAPTSSGPLQAAAAAEPLPLVPSPAQVNETVSFLLSSFAAALALRGSSRGVSELGGGSSSSSISSSSSSSDDAGMKSSSSANSSSTADGADAVGGAGVEEEELVMRREMAAAASSSSDAFVRRRGRNLVLRGNLFYANGFNTYWLMYVARIPDQRPLVNVVLRQAKELGLTVCRTGAFYDGPGWNALQTQPGVYDEKTFQALDYVLETARRFGVRLLLVLSGNWNDYGGKPQYVQWSRQQGGNPPNDDTAFFIDGKCRQWYKNFVQTVITRRNTINGRVYRDDPTIFGWDLMNEPRVNDDPSGNVLQNWIVEMSAHVKSLDPNHLVSVGLEGFYGKSTPSRQWINAEAWMANVGTDFVRNHQAPNLDIASVHAYANSRYSVSAWSDKMNYYTTYIRGHIEDCERVLNMPLLVGEFGPDSFRNADGSMDKRNQVYSATYQVMLDSAKRRGAGAVAMFWQLSVGDLRSWDDGIAVYADDSSHAQTVAIIGAQSAALRSLPRR